MPIFGPSELAKYIPKNDPTTTDSRPNESQPLYRIGQMAATGGNVADLATSLNLLSKPGFRESNPLMGGSTGAQLAGKTAATLGELYGMHKLAQAGHPKIAGGLGLMFGAIPAIAAIHNARLNR